MTATYAAGGTDAPTLWGLDAEMWHDRYWAAHGVAVVRRGTGRRIPTAGAYLLLEAGEMVFFASSAALRRARRAAAAVRLTVADVPDAGVSEHVVADASARLVAVARRYEPARERRLTLVMTADRRQAERWHAAAGRRGALRDVTVAAGIRGTECIDLDGRVFAADRPDESTAALAVIAAQRPDLARGITGVHSPARDVWVHDDAEISAGARLRGPSWVGAGIAIAGDAALAGPAVRADRLPVEIADPEPLLLPAARVTPTPSPVPGGPPTAPARPGKRAFDLAFSALALLFTAPLFPMIMLAIWLEDGRPLFFRQRRQTRGGRDFECLKFRTMHRNADDIKHRVADQNICDGPQFHIENDPRLLRVGHFLRRYHLDELPQFVNVLLGQMSVIGPRPSPERENQCCPAWREARLSVRPGITGLWQIRRTRAPGRDFQEWIEHDLAYVERQSWRLDRHILVETIARLVRPARTRRAPVVAAPPLPLDAAATLAPPVEAPVEEPVEEPVAGVVGPDDERRLAA